MLPGRPHERRPPYGDAAGVPRGLREMVAAAREGRHKIRLTGRLLHLPWRVREVTESIDQVCLSLVWVLAGGSLDPETEFEWMFRTEYQPVLRTVMLVVRDLGRAEDITQEAFIQLLGHWRKISRYERPDAWVRRVAIRLAVRAARRERLRPLLERGARAPIETVSADPDVAQAIGKLSPVQRACVVLYYFEDRPMAEVADITGVSVTAAKVTVHRARRRLAELIGEEVDEDVR